MYQNYPNPFNPSTNIKYELARSGNVSLKIYDVTGKEISTFVNERQTPGSYSVEFSGSDLPSGVYFYKIEVTPGISGQRFVDTKRMILLK